LNLKDNYQHTLAEIADACTRCGRNPADVHLIAVSKTHPVTLVDELAKLGQIDFGENRIAELAEKRAQLQSKPVQWHLIGQLQTNKVKLLDADTILHSLDRVSLSEKLAQRFAGESLRCLIQVNCSGEANKSGVLPEALPELCDHVAKHNELHVLGLMTMAENTEDENTVRRSFTLLRSLSEKVSAQKIFPQYAGWLSMGMSGDFRLAIAEGATHVRIGSAIFGHR